LKRTLLRDPDQPKVAQEVVVKAGEVDNPAWAAGAVEECPAAQAQAARDQR
jgi:hypothetical protein